MSLYLRKVDMALRLCLGGGVTFGWRFLPRVQWMFDIVICIGCII
jgi:hypothetical protein